MAETAISPRVLASSASLALALVVLMSCGSPVPEVSIEDLSSMEDGARVKLGGLVCEIWAWDDGTENIVLVETTSTASLTVVCAQALRPQPGTYVRVGDMIEVVGEVSDSHASRRLYTNSDDVTLVLRSSFVLTVGALSNCWELFEGDDIEVRGILSQDSTGLTLRDTLSSRRMSLVSAMAPPQALLGQEVVVRGQIQFDKSSMSVILEAESIVPAP